MSGLQVYVIKGSNVKFHAIQLIEENLDELTPMFQTRLFLKDGQWFVTLENGEPSLISYNDDWLVLLDEDTRETRILKNEDFQSRFELFVEKAPVAGSLFNVFKERLEKHYEKLKADGQISPDIDTEGLFEMLSNGLLMVENNEDAGLTIALAALLLHDRGEFTPAQLIEADQQGKAE